MSSLAQRVLTAAVLILLVGGCLYFLPARVAIVLPGFFLLAACWEWSGFLYSSGPLLPRIFYVLVLLLMAGGVFYLLWTGTAPDMVLMVAAGWWIIVLLALIYAKPGNSRFACVLAGVMGLVPAWYAVLRLFGADNGILLFVWVVAIVAAADIGAYFVGRSLGRNKLAPQISPGKTREGALGGIICAALVAAAGARSGGLDLYLYALAGVLIAIASIAGDLTVSVFKRSAGVKDSGSLLPGHGGVLDRIDGLIAALPLFVLILLLAGQLSAGWQLTG